MPLTQNNAYNTEKFHKNGKFCSIYNQFKISQST